MIIKQHKRFSWPNMALNIVEIVVLLLAAGWMFNQIYGQSRPGRCKPHYFKREV